MTRRFALVVTIIVLAGPSVASAECDLVTTPLDCITLLDPTLTKEQLWGPMKIDGLVNEVFLPGVSGSGHAGGTGFDAAGNFYFLKNIHGPREVEA